MQPMITCKRALTTLILAMGLSLAVGFVTAVGAAIQDLSASQFKQRLDQETKDADAVLLDLRTPEEYRTGHIQGAVLLNYYARDFVDKLKTLDREKTYLVYCRSGNRSARSLAVFKQLGFQRVYHLKTGILGWLGAKYPLVK